MQWGCIYLVFPSDSLLANLLTGLYTYIYIYNRGACIHKHAHTHTRTHKTYIGIVYDNYCSFSVFAISTRIQIK